MFVNKFKLKECAIICLLLLAVFANAPIYTLLFGAGAVAVGLILRIPLPTIFIISLPFAVDINTIIVFNFNMSDIVLPMLLIQQLLKFRRLKQQNKKVLKTIFLWSLFLMAAFLLSALFTTSLDILSYSVALGKSIIACLYLFTGGLLIANSSNDIRLGLIKTWVFVAALLSGMGIIANILSLSIGTLFMMYAPTRLGISFANPNSLAAYLLISLVLAIFLNFVSRSKIISAATVLISAATCLTYSRAGLIALGLIALLGFFLFLHQKKYLRDWTLFVGILGITYLLIMPVLQGISWLTNQSVTYLTGTDPYLYSPAWHNINDVKTGNETFPPSTSTMSSTTSPISAEPSANQHNTVQEIQVTEPQIAEEASATPTKSPVANGVEISHTRDSIEGDARFTVWEKAIQLWINSPLIGVGLGQFPNLALASIGVFIVVHNTFLSFLTETGIVGFSILILGLCGIFISLWKSPVFSGKILLLGVIAIGTMMLSNNLEFFRSALIFLASSYTWGKISVRKGD